MQVYGYVGLSSDGSFSGKQSDVELFISEKDRNDAMFGDYQATFDTFAENEGFDEVEDDSTRHIDAEGDPELTEEEFMQKLKDSEDVNNEVFGIIHGHDSYVQYEPFCKEL